MRKPYSPTVQSVLVNGNNEAQMRETIRRIGRAIRRASVYPPIRNYAASVASTAPPKNFLGQLQAVYKDITKRWRYVRDPVSRELVTNSPEAIWRLTMAGDGVGAGAGYGVGDCDCISVALGAVLESIGFKTRLGTTANRGSRPGRLFGHVFIQAAVPGFGWVTVDPVLHPRKSFGAVATHSRIAFWDLDGNMVGARGNYTGGLGQNSAASEYWKEQKKKAEESIAKYKGAIEEYKGASEKNKMAPLIIIGLAVALGALTSKRR